MYLVKIYDGPQDIKGLVVHDYYTADTKLIDPVINLDISDIPNMSFTLTLNNPAWNKIKPFKTLIRVFRMTDNKKVFDGRVLNPVQKMDSSGMFSIDYVCEGRKAYLHDSMQRHGEYRNITIRDFLGVILDNHNRQVELHKQFKLGTVTVTNPTDNVYRYLGYESTFDTIKDKLIDRLGGYLVVRDEADGMYLDYLSTVGEVSEQPIRLAYNMQNLKRDIDPTNIITRLVPLGASIESEDETATDASKARLTIAPVNDGLDYLDDQLLIDEFGVIEGAVVWDDVHELPILKSRGQQFLDTQKAARVSIDSSVLNVDLLDGYECPFEVGNFHRVDNEILKINEPVQITGMKINIDEPQKFGLKIGEKQQTLSQYQADANRRMRMAQELESRVVFIGENTIKTNESVDELKQRLESLENSVTPRSSILRVCTFNIWWGQFNIEQYKNFAVSNRLDIIGMQEVRDGNPPNLKINHLNNVEYANARLDYGNAIQSHMALTPHVVHELPTIPTGASRRILMKTSLVFEDRNVSVYNTHLDANLDNTARLAQLNYIKQTMDADSTEYKILIGDFNLRDKEHYKLLGNLKSAQGFNGVWHDTWDVSVEPWDIGAIDNILVTQNIDILNVTMPTDRMGSDHHPLWCEMVLK